ncbi:MAG: hypothetical protein EXR61_06265 [Chloroflexi bacterium]|nr:hypothetical protein [Chloroflexota bacterium]
MGTRYEDQPPEHWAGPESLDPTPVWKQFLIVGLLLLTGLGMIGVFAYLALGAQLATPPALVPGGRLVLARSEVPALGAPAKRVGPPLIGEAQTFYLAQPEKGEVVALRALWAPGDELPACLVEPGRGVGFAVRCGADFVFGPNGEPTGAPRALDRYLVSIEGERIVVNLSRVIGGYGRLPQPTILR